MKRVLLVGNGGREHAIAEALKRTPDVELYCFGSTENPGISAIADGYHVGNYMDFDAVREYAKKTNPTVICIGPDDPIGQGLTDVLQAAGLAVFAPTRANAQLESSKGFCREILTEYAIDASPDYSVLTEMTNMQSFYDKHNGQIVVKADGLLGGKGVIVAGDHFEKYSEAAAFAKASIEKFGRVVLEEKLIGVEFSLISITDGETHLHCPAVQDHKRAHVGDTGPNTGGMGTITGPSGLLPFLTKADVIAAQTITAKVLKAVQNKTSERYAGVMFGGFMKTKNGVKLIEYNCRFGDPEALNLMTLLESDLYTIMEQSTKKTLQNVPALSWKKEATVLKYLCPNGYPTASVKNEPITIESPLPEGSTHYVSSVAKEREILLLKGSRAIGVIGMGITLEAANTKCEQAIKHFTGPLFYREDIGTKAMIQQRIDMVKSL